jgi:hypothetical protein
MKKALFSSFLLLVTAILTGNLNAQIVISDDGNGTGTTIWTSDNTYVLDGLVFVNSGQVLTIEAGTVIKGKPGTGADASALVVARGGQIMAMGTMEDPIVFTFESDPLDGSTPYSTRGQWGGLIVLGDAQLNSTPGETQVEGIPETEPRGIYGGTNDEDNSGIIQYISIRHGGTDIGAGNEINGLTLGGVGAGTVIEHIEVVSNADDGIEFFGGTASVKWACVAFCSDDSFDYDEGWRGKGQFWFAVQDNNGDGLGDRGGEHDGGTDPEDGAPYAHPIIFNSTYMGRGISAGKRALTFRDNAAGEYHNSIFYNWGKGIDVENLASGEDSYSRFVSGELAFAGNCFYETAVAGGGATASDLFKISMGTGWSTPADSTAELTASNIALQASFTTQGNEVTNPELTYLVQEGSNALIAIPGVTLNGNAPTDGWYEDVNFKGAFDPATSCSWLTGWSFLDSRGFLGCTNNIENYDKAIAQFQIYPNPTNGDLNVIATETLNQVVIEVYGIQGNVIVRDQVGTVYAGQSIHYDLGQYENGIYVIRLISENDIFSKRFVKQ